jgi:hypothetical protein
MSGQDKLDAVQSYRFHLLNEIVNLCRPRSQTCISQHVDRTYRHRSNSASHEPTLEVLFQRRHLLRSPVLKCPLPQPPPQDNPPKPFRNRVRSGRNRNAGGIVSFKRGRVLSGIAGASKRGEIDQGELRPPMKGERISIQRRSVRGHVKCVGQGLLRWLCFTSPALT